MEKINNKEEVVVEEVKEVQIVKGQVDGLQNMVEETVVENNDQLSDVSDKIKEVKKVIKSIKAEMAKTIDPAKAIVEVTKERFNPYLEKCKQAEIDLKKKAEVFMLAEEKKEQDKRDKIAAKAESGYLKPETAVEQMEEVPEATKTAKTGASSLSMRKLKVPGEIDEKLVPEEYFIPRQLDMVKIAKVVKAGVEIPGVQVIEKASMASR